MSGFSDWVASVKDRFEDAFVRDPASQRKTGLVVARTQPSLLEEKEEEEEEKKPTSELFHEFLDRERIEEQQRSLGGGVTEPPAETGGEEQQRLVIQEEEALPKEGFGGEEAPASEPLYPSLAAAPVPFVPVEKPKAPAPDATVVVRYQWRAATDEEKMVLWLNGKWRILCVNMTIITFFAIAVFLLVLRFSYIIFRLDD